MTLLKRILAEKRAVIVPLVLAALVNVAAYALVVYPLGVKSAGAADRAMAASRALEAAERDLAVARALVTAKSRAEQALTTFYLKVLPADLPAARRMTYAHLPALARRTRVKYEERRFEVEQGLKTARLGHLRIKMLLQCEYESFRQFIYALESASPFVIIDGVSLAQSDPAKPLTLIMELSTYFRLGTNGN